MIKRLVVYLRRFSYPQYVFAASIKRFIKPDAKGVLLDVPCGNGVTSWALSSIKELNVFGYDISSNAIHIAKESFERKNLNFEVSDIRNALSKHPVIDYFCIINSLFLLPEPDSILEDVKGVLKKEGALFVILPNADSRAFKWFQKDNPGVNKLILRESELEEHFSSCGWRMFDKVPIVYARSYKRKDVFFFSILAPVYLGILNRIQTLLKLKEPNYFLLVLRKKM
jgi:2-polyprenyl-3-methyl-5-hydroxy-6-metoxy-1,4-benzoquinol methylase